MSITYLNGDYLPANDARLHVSDLSILRGYGIFDFFRYEDGKPIFLDDHIRRFRKSGDHLGLKIPLCKADLAEVVHQLIARNGGGDGGIRLVLTGGYSPDGYTPAKPNLIGFASPPYVMPEEVTTRGIKVYLHRYERQLPRAKTIDYVEGIRIQPLLKELGADYALYLDRNDMVRESDRSNFLIVKDGTLVTPEDKILLGITRRHLLKLAAQLGIPTEQRDVSKEELLAADEAIICSSVKSALGIVEVNGVTIGDGRPGPITKQLEQNWRAYYRSV